MMSSEFDGRLLNAGRGPLGAAEPRLALVGLTVLMIATFATVLAITYLVSDAPPQNLALRCDQSAVAEADSLHGHDTGSREWRSDRYRSFKRCVDQSLSTSHFLSP
jgi:hypothetical protein